MRFLRVTTEDHEVMTMRNRRLAYMIAAALAAQTTLGIAAAQETRQDRDSTRAAQDRAMPPSASTDDRGMTKNVSGDKFADQAAIISKAEIELGQLALERSNDDNVKQFAKKMVTDHTNSSAKLKNIAAKQNIDLPETLDAEHRATKQKLSSLKGAEFDREYSKAMAKGHDKAVALFESASQSAEVPSDLKQFAASTLPTLREHRKMAHSLHGDETGGRDRTASDQ